MNSSSRLRWFNPAMPTIDFGKTAPDYARYRVPFAARLFVELRERKLGLAGQNILDVAAGTGLFGARLCEAGCEVTCVDVSQDLLRQAPRDVRKAVARVEALPFANQAFDIVTAAQCWHWLDRNTAPKEILRVLVPRGYVVVVYQTYIPLPGSPAEQTENLILHHRPRWRHANSTGINGQVLRDLQINGFAGIESFSFDESIAFSRQSWRGYVRTISAVGASMSPVQLRSFENEHEEMLRNFPDELQIPHRIFAVIARKQQAGV